MPHHISELQLDSISEGFSVLAQSGSSRRLTGLSKINLFVGPNNSGKSRFLRELAKIQKPVFVPTDERIQQIEAIRKQFVTGVNHLLRGPVVEIDGLKETTATIRSFELVHAGSEPMKEFDQAIKKAHELVGRNISFAPGIASAGHQSLMKPLEQLGHGARAAIDKVLTGTPLKWEFKRIYVPTLRGLRTFENTADHYAARTMRDYFSGPNPPEVVTGLALYSEIRTLLLGDLKQRLIVERFEKFLGDTFFDSKEVAIIPREGSDVLYIKIGEEEEQSISNLGDGIQMIVAIMFPLFRSQDENVLLFVEEPELYLHPGMQRTLVGAIAAFQNAQCFVATHSNHLLDLTTDRSDISIFSLRKELTGADLAEKRATFFVENLSSGDQRVLNQLGVRNSSVFLSNCTIWVEGITDRRYIRRFLRLYMEDFYRVESGAILPFKEDLHYSFVEYAGANITHWSFLDNTMDPILVERLCGRLMLISDRDDSRSKDERHEKLAKKLGERFVRLECQEIENILAADTIRAVVADYEGVNEADIETPVYASYQRAPLGEYIETNLLGEKNRRGSYRASSGTLTDKITFCDRALNHLFSHTQLSADALSLAERLHRFILEQNKG
jgi:hypothetical protein